MLWRSQPQGQNNPFWISFSDLMAALLIIFILVCIALLYRLTIIKTEYMKTMTLLEQNNAELAQYMKAMSILEQNSAKLAQYMKAMSILEQNNAKLAQTLNKNNNAREKVSRELANLGKAIKERARILTEIRDELKKSGIQVEIAENFEVLRIGQDQLHYDSNKHNITDAMQDIAEKIGSKLFAALNKNRRYENFETVFIEGHSDSRPTSNYGLGNWELSALRAISLWQYWLDKTSFGEKLKNMHNQNGKPLFSVSGYADTRRVDEEESDEEGLRKNRRIDIRFVPIRPELENFAQSLDAAESTAK